ncbi:hypothetical protein B0H16DRAFT_1701066 [Mycena metata]|uniref:F-box domain-containing protein n=1 Tax=Mycena metata TaxID=1033252 RepID=A0AAD7HD88_9AGAR|nr:hypothetical protein B0H16DRAFT_1701066 [Mycena metata]
MSPSSALNPGGASAVDLPFELTSKIFVLCLPIRGRVRPHGKLAPLLLAQIYSQWRAVALETPQLWRSIHLGFSQPSAHDSLPLLFGLPGFVEFNNLKGPFPFFQSLSIQITDSPEPFVKIAVNTMLNSPRLVALHLLNERGPRASYNGLAAIPDTITTLQASQAWNSSGTFDSHSKLFDHLPHLIHLGTISGSISTSYPGTSTPHLSTREFEFLDIPTLEHLQLYRRRSATHQVSRVSLRPTQTHLPRPGAFALAPGLVTLQLVFIAGGGSASLTVHCDMLQHPTLLPSLRNLIITDAASSRPAYDSFVALLQRRRTLEHAELHISPRYTNVRLATQPPGAGILSELAALVATGLTVRVITPNYAWPVNARHCDPVGDLDHDVFGSRLLRPYHFSPF